LKGHVDVLRKKERTQLQKGQSLTVKVGDPSAPVIGRTGDSDDFDHWVSGRIDGVSTATHAALDYSSSSGYVPGYADLMTYGSWYPVGGYGYGWRPYGFGPGWCPFDGGGWYNDPAFGWTFIGNQPWGWLPYHYGSWLFDPAFGWIRVPGGSNGFALWRPSTGA